MKKLILILAIFALLTTSLTEAQRSDNTERVARDTDENTRPNSPELEVARERLQNLREEARENNVVARERLRILNHNNEEIDLEVEYEEVDGILERRLRMREHMIESRLELMEERDNNRSKLRAKLSNGNNQEIKVMPDRASEIALERLRAKNLQIELKEVGNRAVYEGETERRGRVLGLFKTNLQERIQIDAETGEVNKRGPWWAFLFNEDTDQS